jgi:hypothetical protein
MKIPRENIRWNRGSIRRDFREFVSSLIISARDVVELEAVEFVLKAPHLLAVGFHLRMVAARVLHDQVDHELEISTNIEVSNPELDGDTQTVNKGLVLSYVVGGCEVEPDHVAHVNSEGRDEEQACTRSYFGHRLVEVHGPQLGLKLNRRRLGVGPFF